MNRDTKRGFLIVIIALLSIIAVALCGIFGLLLFRQSSFGIHLGIDKSYPTVMTRNEDMTYSAIDISLIAGEVKLLNSEDGKLHYSIQADEKKLTVTEKDGALLIVDKSKSRRWKTQNTSRITLSVPADFSGTFKVKSDAGNITADSFPAATLLAEADAGMIKVGDIGSIKADCDAGNISIGAIHKSADISADAGNVVIDKANITENSKIECDFGNITVRELGDVKVNAICSVGKSTVNKSNPQATVVLAVEADCGNINIG